MLYTISIVGTASKFLFEQLFWVITNIVSSALIILRSTDIMTIIIIIVFTDNSTTQLIKKLDNNAVFHDLCTADEAALF